LVSRRGNLIWGGRVGKCWRVGVEGFGNGAKCPAPFTLYRVRTKRCNELLCFDRVPMGQGWSSTLNVTVREKMQWI
jgi:hypothetical protein